MSFVSARGEGGDWTPPEPGTVCTRCGWIHSDNYDCRKGQRPQRRKPRRPGPTGDWAPSLTPPTGYAQPIAPFPCPQCGEGGGHHNQARHPSPAAAVRVVERAYSQPERKRPRAEIGRPHLLEELGDVCYFCGDLLDAFSITREHLTPVSRGGMDEEVNVVAACRICNGAKGNRTEEEFRSWLLQVAANYLG